MFRMWCKIITDNHLIRDTVIIDSEAEKSRTAKVFSSLEKACHDMDLAVPIWLDSTVKEFKRHDKARFYQDSFIEQIDFDFLEIHIIEED